MAAAELAIGIELIERRDVVAAPALCADRGRSGGKPGKVDRHRAVFGLELERSGEIAGQLRKVGALACKLGLEVCPCL